MLFPTVQLFRHEALRQLRVGALGWLGLAALAVLIVGGWTLIDVVRTVGRAEGQGNEWLLVPAGVQNPLLATISPDDASRLRASLVRYCERDSDGRAYWIPERIAPAMSAPGAGQALRPGEGTAPVYRGDLRGVPTADVARYPDWRLVAGSVTDFGVVAEGDRAPALAGVLVGRLATLPDGREGADSLGMRIAIQGHVCEVVGVFASPDPWFEREVWIPLAFLQRVQREDISHIRVRLAPDTPVVEMERVLQDDDLAIDLVAPTWWRQPPPTLTTPMLLACCIFLLVAGGQLTMLVATLLNRRTLPTVRALQGMGFSEARLAGFRAGLLAVTLLTSLALSVWLLNTLDGMPFRLPGLLTRLRVLPQHLGGMVVLHVLWWLMGVWYLQRRTIADHAGEGG